MNRSLFACVLLLTGCIDYWQDDVPVKSMTVDPNPIIADAWQDRVQWDIYQWRVALPQGCPMPFHFDQDDPEARHVWLVPQADWRRKGAIGEFKHHSALDPWYPHSAIFVLALPNGTLNDYAYDPNWNVVLHELGHSMGLGHADPAYGESLMLTAPDVTIQPRDIEAAACRLHCGPCGPDPYDIP